MISQLLPYWFIITINDYFRDSLLIFINHYDVLKCKFWHVVVILNTFMISPSNRIDIFPIRYHTEYLIDFGNTFHLKSENEDVLG